MPIASFADRAAEEFFISGKVRKGAGWSNIAKVVARKLDMIRYGYAARLTDLKSLPGNQLEELSADLKGWHSIRVNDRWRVLFVWTEDGAANVKVVDYH